MIDAIPENVTRSRVIELARGWISTPYHHQASVRGVGADCLGLVRGVWRELYGYDAEAPPAYTRDWGETSSLESMLMAAARHLVHVKIADMQPGDVVLFRMRPSAISKHAAILVTPSTFVHASEGGPASEVALSRWWRRKITAAFRFPGV